MRSKIDNNLETVTQSRDQADKIEAKTCTSDSAKIVCHIDLLRI